MGHPSSTNGHFINLREDDTSSSHLVHTLNVEFDGLYVKFYSGSGSTNVYAKFFSFNQSVTIGSAPPYSINSDDIPDIDLADLIFLLFDDGLYGITTQYYYVNNLIDTDLTYHEGVATFDCIKVVDGNTEDTNISFKIGILSEVYCRGSFIDDILPLQVRYTYIDYKYAGSNSFFESSTRCTYSY